MNRQSWLLSFMGMLLFLLISGVMNTPAYGHKVMVFAYVEGDMVIAEGYFADGKMAQDSQVEVFGHKGDKLLKGRTDENGVFSFPMPDDPELRIVLTASMGHRAECTIKGRSDAVKKEDHEDASPAATKESGGMDTDAAALLESAEERIRSIVSEELDRKLAPLMREMAQLRQERTSLTDIIGGIGYIAGLMGLLMYFKASRPGDN